MSNFEGIGSRITLIARIYKNRIRAIREIRDQKTVYDQLLPENELVDKTCTKTMKLADSNTNHFTDFGLTILVKSRINCSAQIDEK